MDFTVDGVCSGTIGVARHEIKTAYNTGGITETPVVAKDELSACVDYLQQP